MKKFLAIFLSMAMVLCLLTGCGNTPQANETAPAEEPASASAETGSELPENENPLEGYKLGSIDLTPIGLATYYVANNTIEDLCNTFGAEFITVTLTGYGDEDIILAYETLIDEGCDGIIVMAFSESSISILADMMEEAGVDWFLINRQINDPSLKEKVYAMDTFIGNSYCDEENNAYEMVRELSQEHGVKNLAVIGLTQGDAAGDLRDMGIARACEEYGINLLTETRGINTVDDVTNAMEGIIASYPEVDGVFIVGGMVTAGALAGAAQALANHDMSDKVSIAVVDISAGMSDYMGEGQPLKLVTGGNIVMDNIAGAVGIFNHVMGVNVENEPYTIGTHMMTIRTQNDSIDYDEYCDNPALALISGEKWFETIVNKPLDQIQKFFADFSIEVAKSLHE